MADERFRRALRGYDPEEVEQALYERDERVGRLEREAAKLARRVAEQEQRLRETLSAGEGGLGSASAGAIGALSRRLEEIHQQARGQATRMRMRALQDVVRMSDRVSELAKLRDDLGARVQELAALAGIKLQDEEQTQAATEPPQWGPAGEGIYSGEVEVEVGPLADFAQLTAFEDALAGIDGATDTTIRRFAADRASLTITLSEPTNLPTELSTRAPFPLSVRTARPDRLVLDAHPTEHRRAA